MQINEYHPTIATGNNARAILLTQFIRYYKPKGLVVDIQNVAHCPYFLIADIEKMDENLEEYLKTKDYLKTIKEAIIEFFKQPMYKQIGERQ